MGLCGKRGVDPVAEVGRGDGGLHIGSRVSHSRTATTAVGGMNRCRLTGQLQQRGGGSSGSAVYGVEEAAESLREGAVADGEVGGPVEVEGRVAGEGAVGGDDGRGEVRCGGWARRWGDRYDPSQLSPVYADDGGPGRRCELRPGPFCWCTTRVATSLF